MNILKKIIGLAIVFLTITVSQAQDNKSTNTVKFRVEGNCEMCKKTIENSVDAKGVKFANWSIESKMIEITYQPAKISEAKLHELIAQAGYDTDKTKADEKTYKELPDCCQYTRKK